MSIQRIMNLGGSLWRYRVTIDDLRQTGLTLIFRTNASDPDEEPQRFYVIESMFETVLAVGCSRGAVFSVGFNPPDFSNLVESGESPTEPFHLTAQLSAPVSIPPETDVMLNLTRAATAQQHSGIMNVFGYYATTPITK